MTGQESDQGPLLGTPDTCSLGDWPSPRTAARIGGDFAQLIPVNRPAMLAFDAIVKTLQLDPPDLPVHWKGSDTESETEADSGKIWTGHYRFSLDLLPGNPGLGWILGGGRNDMNDQGVDYLLTLQKKQHHVHGRHARFAHHPESGVFMLTVDAGKMVLVNGKERVEGARQAIATVDTGLSVGDLGYRLEFTRLHEKRYREQLTIFRESLGGWLSEGANKEPPRSLEITPSENHYEYHGFIIQSPFGAGGYGMVSPGIEKSTGKAVAVKRLKRTSKSMARIWLEVKIYKEIGDHRNLCHLMADIYSSGDASWTGGSNVNDVYLIHSPLANETFVELTRSNLPYNVRLSAFHQALQGLAHFHLHGIMHRDIKPANLMVVSHNPMHAIIIDYGNATFEETSNDHGCGTIPYLAPEVMELKRCGGVGKPYNCLVDIWGLGLSAYQLFFQAACEWPDGMTRNVFAHISEKLQASSGISQILEIMLGWEAKDRPSSEHLLSLPIWREVSLPPQVQSSQGSLHAVSNKRSRP